jgi:hypothetical protein
MEETKSGESYLPQSIFFVSSRNSGTATSLIAIKGNPMKLPGTISLPAIDKEPLARLSHLPAVPD